MNTEEIKERYDMRDILDMYSLRTNRSGFIPCPFHTGDRQASLKVYRKDFHCFGCGANGDIFTFVQMIEECSFKEAFERLGGTYEASSSFAQKLAVYKHQKAIQSRKRTEEQELAKRKENNDRITYYRNKLLNAVPMSDEWTEAYNRLQYQIYVQSQLTGTPW